MDFYEKENVSLYLSKMSLIEKRSGIQDVSIYSHPCLGKILVINEELQHVEKWNPLYHEAITHIPLMFLKKPQKVLIIGGGDLYAANILLQYPSIQKIDICDYDMNVISLTEKYYPHGNKVTQDNRTNLVIEDAKKYIYQTSNKYDLIIDDCFNLVKDFSDADNIFGHLYNMLSPDGICCSLVYRHIFDSMTMKFTIRKLLQKKKTVISLIAVPEYPGCLHMLTMWGTSKCLSQELKMTMNEWQKNCIENNIQCGELFDPRFCQYYLYIPKYLKKCIEEYCNV